MPDTTQTTNTRLKMKIVNDGTMDFALPSTAVATIHVDLSKAIWTQTNN